MSATLDTVQLLAGAQLVYPVTIGDRQMINESSFDAPELVAGRASIADLFRPSKRCGLYILHFDNGEFYAGQAIDVTRGYVQHRKVHSDICDYSTCVE